MFFSCRVWNGKWLSQIAKPLKNLPTSIPSFTRQPKKTAKKTESNNRPNNRRRCSADPRRRKGPEVEAGSQWHGWSRSPKTKSGRSPPGENRVRDGGRRVEHCPLSHPQIKASAPQPLQPSRLPSWGHQDRFLGGLLMEWAGRVGLNGALIRTWGMALGGMAKEATSLGQTHALRFPSCQS